MNWSLPAYSSSEPFEATDVRDFCHQFWLQQATRLRGLGVYWTLDIDESVWFRVPRQWLHRLLSQCFEESLEQMPKGGTLDCTVLVTRRGLEVEIADSSEADNPGASFARLSNSGESNEGVWRETYRCPQGGVARTVVVPWADPQKNAVAPNRSRRVA